MNFEEIIGEKISSISMLIWDDKINPIKIEQILIELSNNKLLLEIDNEFDEVIIRIDNSIQLSKPEKEHSIILDNNSDFELMHLMDGEITWIWTLNNNRGYDDGFQLNVWKNNMEYLYQFLIIASEIKVYKLAEKENIHG